MKVLAEDAKAFFADESQQLGGLNPDDLHDNGVIYYVDGPVCGVFHDGMWPGVWMAHYGMKPEGRGNYDEPAKRVLQEFWDDNDVDLIIGWTPSTNKRAIAFAKRLGFEKTGTMHAKDEEVIMQELKL